jgi:hypothetical protein
MRLAFLIVASALIALSGFIYARGIVRGTTKPDIASWITWALITSIATAAEFASGATYTAIFTGVNALGLIIIVFLGLRYGIAKYSRFDIVCQSTALIGFILWWVLNDPIIAIIASVSIDFTGSLPTIRHSWLRPQEESWAAYVISALGSAFSIASLSSYSLASLAYPVYIMLICALIAMVIVVRRGRIAIKKTRRAQ